MLDLPGIIEGAKDGKGRGKQVIAVARTCSLIFIVLDVLKPLLHKKLIEKELEGFGIRLNKVRIKEEAVSLVCLSVLIFFLSYLYQIGYITLHYPY